jgi:hypothetical protein
MIYETAIYCDKEWRILNLNTGTIYSQLFETEQQALNNIRHNEKRDDHYVFRISLRDICNYLYENRYSRTSR